MKKGSCILLVEDNLDLAGLQAQMLEMQPEKYQVKTVHTGRDAQAVLQQQLPDIILLDLTIPAPDGLSLLRWMKHQKRFSVPVIVTSGCTDEKIQWEALRLGASYFMIKPYPLDDLLSNIKILLDSCTNSCWEEAQQDKRKFLVRANNYLRAMTSHIESDGFRYVLMGVENYYDLGRAGISMKALSEKVGHPIEAINGNNSVEAAIYRLVQHIWKENSPMYQKLCASCGADSRKRMPVRRFLTALGDISKQPEEFFGKDDDLC